MTKIRKTKLVDLPDRTSTLIGYAAGRGNVDYNTSKSVIYLFHEKLLSYLFQNYTINIPWFKPIRWGCTFSRFLKSNNWFKGVRYPERKFYIDTELENNVYYKVELVQKKKKKKIPRLKIHHNAAQIKNDVFIHKRFIPPVLAYIIPA